MKGPNICAILVMVLGVEAGCLFIYDKQPFAVCAWPFIAATWAGISILRSGTE